MASDEENEVSEPVGRQQDDQEPPGAAVEDIDEEITLSLTYEEIPGKKKGTLKLRQKVLTAAESSKILDEKLKIQ